MQLCDYASLIKLKHVSNIYMTFPLCDYLSQPSLVISEAGKKYLEKALFLSLCRG